MPRLDEMIEEALREAKLASIDSAMAKRLVNQLLDGGNIPDEKALQVLATEKGNAQTLALIEILKKEQPEARSSKKTSDAEKKQQDAQLLGLLTGVRNHFSEFQRSHPQDNPKLIGLFNSMIEDLYNVATASGISKIFTIVAILPGLWKKEEQIRILLGEQAQAQESADFIALLEKTQPLISLMACAQFLFPASTKDAIAASPTTFAWFYMIARILNAKIDFAEKNRLAVIPPPPPLEDIAEAPVGPLVESFVEVPVSVPLKTIAADPLEQKHQELATAQAELRALQEAKARLEPEKQEKIRQLEMQKQALQQTLKEREESKAVLAKEAGMPMLREHKSVDQFIQELETRKTAADNSSFADLQAEVLSIGESHNAVFRQERAILSDLESNLLQYEASANKENVDATQKLVDILTIALAAIAANASPADLEKLKALDPKSMDRLLDNIHLDDLERKEFKEFFDKLRDPAPKPPASRGFLWGALTSLVSEDTLRYYAYLNPTVHKRLEVAITGQLDKAQAWLKNITTNHQLVVKDIEKTQANLAILEEKYSAFMESIPAHLEVVATQQMTGIEQEFTAKAEQLTTRATAKTQQIAGLEAEVRALQERAVAEAEAARAAEREEREQKEREAQKQKELQEAKLKTPLLTEASSDTSADKDSSPAAEADAMKQVKARLKLVKPYVNGLKNEMQNFESKLVKLKVLGKNDKLIIVVEGKLTKNASLTLGSHQLEYDKLFARYQKAYNLHAALSNKKITAAQRLASFTRIQEEAPSIRRHSGIGVEVFSTDSKKSNLMFRFFTRNKAAREDIFASKLQKLVSDEAAKKEEKPRRWLRISRGS